MRSSLVRSALLGSRPSGRGLPHRWGRPCDRGRPVGLLATDLAALARRSGIEISLRTAKGVGCLILLDGLRTPLEGGAILLFGVALGLSVAAILKVRPVLRLAVAPILKVRAILRLPIDAILKVRAVLRLSLGTGAILKVRPVPVSSGALLLLLYLRWTIIPTGVVVATAEFVVPGIILVDVAV
jgi:hypothetical protein